MFRSPVVAAKGGGAGGGGAALTPFGAEVAARYRSMERAAAAALAADVAALEGALAAE
jgi:molybdate transport system regulatory protein